MGEVGAGGPHFGERRGGAAPSQRSWGAPPTLGREKKGSAEEGASPPRKEAGVPHPPAVEREKTEVKGPPPLYMEGVPRGQKLLRHR